jgi:hypothetical protein
VLDQKVKISKDWLGKLVRVLENHNDDLRMHIGRIMEINDYQNEIGISEGMHLKVHKIILQEQIMRITIEGETQA